MTATLAGDDPHGWEAPVVAQRPWVYCLVLVDAGRTRPSFDLTRPEQSANLQLSAIGLHEASQLFKSFGRAMIGVAQGALAPRF